VCIHTAFHNRGIKVIVSTSSNRIFPTLPHRTCHRLFISHGKVPGMLTSASFTLWIKVVFPLNLFRQTLRVIATQCRRSKEARSDRSKFFGVSIAEFTSVIVGVQKGPGWCFLAKNIRNNLISAKFGRSNYAASLGWQSAKTH